MPVQRGYYSHMTERWYAYEPRRDIDARDTDAVRDLLVGAAGILVGPKCGELRWDPPLDYYGGAGAASQ